MLIFYYLETVFGGITNKFPKNTVQHATDYVKFPYGVVKTFFIIRYFYLYIVYRAPILSFKALPIRLVNFRKKCFT